MILSLPYKENNTIFSEIPFFLKEKSIALPFGELNGAGSKRLHEVGKLRDRRAQRVLH